MSELNDKQIAEFYKRSFSTIDGLWFMKVEEKYGFDAALKIDDEVWKVLPKIQARLVKSMCDQGNGIEALYECLKTKMKIDGFKFVDDIRDDKRGFNLVITDCPWHDLMVKSGREHLSGKVGTLVCNTEYSVWAAEFDNKIRFKLKSQLCEKAQTCTMQFEY